MWFKKKVTAVIYADLASLRPMTCKVALKWVVDTMKHCSQVDDVVVIIPSEVKNMVIAKYCLDTLRVAVMRIRVNSPEPTLFELEHHLQKIADLTKSDYIVLANGNDVMTCAVPFSQIISCTKKERPAFVQVDMTNQNPVAIYSRDIFGGWRGKNEIVAIVAELIHPLRAWAPRTRKQIIDFLEYAVRAKHYPIITVETFREYVNAKIIG